MSNRIDYLGVTVALETFKAQSEVLRDSGLVSREDMCAALVTFTSGFISACNGVGITLHPDDAKETSPVVQLLVGDLRKMYPKAFE
jgi:hypothetical protein